MDVNTIIPESKELIVLSFDSDKVTFQEVYTYHKNLKEAFPNTYILTIPKDICVFREYKWQTIKKLIKSIYEIIKI